jgi:hypothetical protein
MDTNALECILGNASTLRRIRRDKRQPTRIDVFKASWLNNGKGATFTVEWEDGTSTSSFVEDYLTFGSWIAARRKWGHSEERSLVREGIYIGVVLTFDNYVATAPTILDQLNAVIWGKASE